MADGIRLRILSGELPVGSRLPPQDAFAAHLGVARSVLREALAALERAGYLETRRGRTGGSFVLPPAAVTAGWLAEHPARVDEVRDAFEYRIAVEGHAAALAARHRTAADLVVLSGAVAVGPGRPLPAHEFRLADARFHGGVAAAARNAYLDEAVRHARAEVFLRTDWLLFDQDLDRLVAEHSAVLEAVAAGDEEAARDRMVEHLAATLEAWEQLVRPQ